MRKEPFYSKFPHYFGDVHYLALKHASWHENYRIIDSFANFFILQEGENYLWFRNSCSAGPFLSEGIVKISAKQVHLGDVSESNNDRFCVTPNLELPMACEDRFPVEEIMRGGYCRFEYRFYR